MNTSTIAEVAASGPIILACLAAAAAGFVSFASPCVVPLVPGYMSYLASIVGGGMDIDGNNVAVAKKGRFRVAGAALLFILGFSVIFLLGTATVFGAISALALNAGLLQKIGGVITVIMGLAFMGLIPVLQNEKRFHPQNLSTWIGAPVLGGIFALGWTPCLGPTLASIISISAGTSGTTAIRGIVLIIFYCLGLGIPFIVVALGSARAMTAVGWLSKHSRHLQIFGGVLLVLVGLALVSGLWDYFISWVRQWTVSFGATLI
ncbi:MAG: cytochrome c biogenesis CcdA family protein [Corynebacterium sp.]|nr:cytochrome c biogenesis CcdA family protein [Corynebacterium sp.]